MAYLEELLAGLDFDHVDRVIGPAEGEVRAVGRKRGVEKRVIRQRERALQLPLGHVPKLAPAEGCRRAANRREQRAVRRERERSKLVRNSREAREQTRAVAAVQQDLSIAGDRKDFSVRRVSEGIDDGRGVIDWRLARRENAFRRRGRVVFGAFADPATKEFDLLRGKGSAAKGHLDRKSVV